MVQCFLALHRPGEPLVLPNPWDAGTHGFWDEAIEGVEVRKRAFS
jgi:hypothetical protein